MKGLGVSTTRVATLAAALVYENALLASGRFLHAVRAGDRGPSGQGDT